MSLRNGGDLFDLKLEYPADKVVVLNRNYDYRAKICLAYYKGTVKISNKILTPIELGKVSSEREFGNLGDDTGNDISDLNSSYAELKVH